MFTEPLMSAVVSIRVPEELKKRMRKAKINWSEEIRRFIEERLAEYEAEMLRQRIRKHLEKIPELPAGTTVRWIRSDRESH